MIKVFDVGSVNLIKDQRGEREKGGIVVRRRTSSAFTQIYLLTNPHPLFSNK